MKLKKNQRVEVFWRDSAADPRFLSETEAIELNRPTAKSVGYFFCETENGEIIISPTLVSDGRRDQISIPKGSIIKIKPLRAK